MKDFRDFVFAATPELSRTAYLLTGDHHLAQDLLQSALANTYRHWGRIWDGNPIAYVRKAMHRERLTWWRRKRVPENLQAQPPEKPAPDFAEQASTRLSLAKALARLTPRQRAVVVLRYYEDLTESETANVLGCSVGSVKRHNHDALARLRETLRAEAEEVPAYDVYDRALATAKRRRLTRIASGVAAAIAVAVLILTGAHTKLLSLNVVPADHDRTPQVPDRIGPPPAFTFEAGSRPLGRASVLFGGEGFGRMLDLDNEGDLGLVGATSDEYRVLYAGYETHAGRDILLSPDGTMVALQSGMPGGGSILDLRTARTHPLGFPAGSYVTPQAWAPDNRQLVVGVWLEENTSLMLVDRTSGHLREIATVAFGQGQTPSGWSVAFSPDGRRLAVQVGPLVRVYETASLRETTQFALPDGARLAGKGAWTPDGTALVTLEDRDPQWNLVRRNANDGKVLEGPTWTVGGSELIVVRLLGWNPLGEPVIAAYAREPDFPARARGIGQLGYGSTHSVRVDTLTAAGPRPLLSAPHNIMSIDVADEAIAGGLVRRAELPRVSMISVLSHPAVAVLVALLIWGAVRWRRRRAR